MGREEHAEELASSLVGAILSRARYPIPGPVSHLLRPIADHPGTPGHNTPDTPQSESTWMTDQSPAAYKTAAADSSRVLRTPDVYRPTDLSPALQESLMHRGTTMHDRRHLDAEHDLIANLPSWMRTGDHHLAHSIGRIDDGRYLVDVPGLPVTYLDLQRKLYVPLGGVHGGEVMATELARRRLQGSLSVGR